MSHLALAETDFMETKYSILKRFFPTANIIFAENSNIILIVEKDNVSLLDKLSFMVSKGADFYHKIKGKKKPMTKDEAQKVANILNEQSKKLESMSVTYRLMATALIMSKDNFADIICKDENIKKIIENPF